MSIVLITPTDYEMLRKTVRHLRAQTAKESLEIIIVAPSAANLEVDLSEMVDFQDFRIVETGAIDSTGKALAAGVRGCAAPVVTYVEEHSYPETAWAETLIGKHSGQWAGVGSVVANANPQTLTSWAHLYTDFGPWVDPAEPGETSQLAGHHTAYKRAALMELGPLLEGLLETDLILNNELRARGHRFYFEPAARSYHLNCSRVGSYFRAEYHGGRLYGAARAQYQHWSPFRRIFYIGGMALIPAVRLCRIIRDIRRTGRQYLLPNVLPIMIAGLIGHTLGEVVGYAFGSGDAARQRVTFELIRRRHVTDEQVPDFAGPDSSG